MNDVARGRRLTERAQVEREIDVAKRRASLQGDDVFADLFAELGLLGQKQVQALCGRQLTEYEQGRAQGVLWMFRELERRVDGTTIDGLLEKARVLDVQISNFTQTG